MKIKCPQCSAVLVIREQAGLEGKVISCPVCKERTPFAKFIKIVEKSQEDHTQYPGEKNDDKTTY